MFAAGAEGPGGPRRIRHYKKKTQRGGTEQTDRWREKQCPGGFAGGSFL